MRTERQREASRINGAKSRGPKSAEGKDISSMNALRRNLLSETLLIEDESDAHFQAHLQQFFDEYQPLPGHETSSVESMAFWRWRQLRLVGMESAAITHEIRNHRGKVQQSLNAVTHAVFATRNLTDHSRILPYIGRELSRCEVQYNRAYHALMQSLSKRATKSHAIEPGVPPPDPANPMAEKELPL